MESWAAVELRAVDLGDVRLERRLVRMVEDIAAQPTASVPRASGDWATTKAAYRFWDNDAVSPAMIRAAHRASTVERVQAEPLALVIQDTTELNLTHHPATTGLGPLDGVTQQGLKVHTALAASADGVPLGVLHQAVWARDAATTGKSQARRKRETAEKESQKWLTALAATEEAVPAGTRLVVIGDREADIYDLFAAPRRPETELLIRGEHNRRVDHDARYLWEAVRQEPALGTLTVAVRRADDRAPRQATLLVRVAALALEPPRHAKQRAHLRPVPVRVVLAEEVDAPLGATPISWLLLTTVPVGTFADAVQCVRWYADRWLIERYHFVLKSGCHLEQLRLETADRVERALATYSIVAWRLLWITYAAREYPDLPCTTVLETHEWQVLCCKVQRTLTPPATPPTLREAVVLIARLGGFLARKRDGQPGVVTLWHGLEALHHLAIGWQLAHRQSPPSLDVLMGKA